MTIQSDLRLHYISFGSSLYIDVSFGMPKYTNKLNVPDLTQVDLFGFMLKGHSKTKFTAVYLTIYLSK